MLDITILVAALIGTAAVTAMCLVGGWIAAGLKPGPAVPPRIRAELYVSSAACLAMLGQVWMLAAGG